MAQESVGKASSGRAASQAFGGRHECAKSQGCPRLSRGSVCRDVSRIGRDFRLRTAWRRRLRRRRVPRRRRLQRRRVPRRLRRIPRRLLQLRLPGRLRLRRLGLAGLGLGLGLALVGLGWLGLARVGLGLRLGFAGLGRGLRLEHASPIRWRRLPIRWRRLPIRWRRLPIRWRRLPIRWRRLPVRWRRLPVRWRRLPIRWRVARRAAHDVRPAPFGAVLLRWRLCLPHGPRRSLRQRVLLPVQ